MDQFWQDKVDFWKNKTNGNQIYIKQAYEVKKDLRKAEKLCLKKDVTFLDVGGYDGRIGMGDVIDIHNGFDLTKDWQEQWNSDGRVLHEHYNIVFTSLTLICFPPEQVQHILREMRRVATDYVYIFEEQPIGYTPQQISAEYGGKWQYNWMDEFRKAGFLPYPGCFQTSKVNPRWVRARVQV